MKTAIGMKIMVFICNECDYHWEQEDFQDWDAYEEQDDPIWYDDDVGCPMCRQKKAGYTPYITYIKSI